MKHAVDKAHKAQVLLVDDHPIVREQLGHLIAQQSDLAVCGECEDGPQCLQMLHQKRPDLVIMDLSLKNSHGLELIKDIKAHDPEMRVLVLSMHEESVFAERALRAGAQGYVTKQESTDVIMTAIRRVLADELFLSERMATQLVGLLIRGPNVATGSLPVNVSDRELEILHMMGNGQNTRQIAEALKIDVKTVDTYRSRLKEKLQVETTAELLQQAIQWVQRAGKR